jgi:hypothetical protein
MMAGSSGDICLFYLQLTEHILRTRSSFRATLSQKVSAGAQVTCDSTGAAPGREAGASAAGTHDDPGAAPSREAGAGAVGICGNPELPPAGRREPLF